MLSRDFAAVTALPAEELDQMLQQMGMEDAETRASQVPALLAQMDPAGSGCITLAQFNVVVTGPTPAIC